MMTIMLLSPLSVWGKGKTVHNQPFLETRLDRNRSTEGERLIYEVVLFSPEEDVAGAEILANPDFGELAVTRSASDSHIDKIERDGKTYYTVVIDRFFIGAGKSGKYEIRGGDYRVGFNRQVRVNDPFWGPMITNRIAVEELTAPDISMQVSPLPEKGKPADYSGAIGDFEVEASLHHGAVAGEESCLLVTVAGTGDLSDAALPDIRSALGEGLQFKSMTDNVSYFIHHGKLGSELEIECVFVADKPGKYVVNPIEFSYFDSEKGKYVKARLKPIEIEVEERKSVREKPPVTMEI